MRNRNSIKKQFTQKLIQQALFGDNIFAQITALALLSKNNDPETGWLLQTLIDNELVFKIRRR